MGTEPLRKACGCGYTWAEGVQMCAMHEAAPELLAALEAVDGQINEVGRYEDPPDAYAELPWETVDQVRAAIAKARKE